MKISSAEFLTSAPDLESCPDEGVEEFAFIGRSNVGKSSLLNMLIPSACKIHYSVVMLVRITQGLVEVNT